MRTNPTGELYQVACNIRKWRQVIGFKQEQLADELGISNVSMSKIETGKTDILLNRLFAIARILNIEVHLLFTDPQDIIRRNYTSPKIAASPEEK